MKKSNMQLKEEELQIQSILDKQKDLGIDFIKEGDKHRIQKIVFPTDKMDIIFGVTGFDNVKNSAIKSRKINLKQEGVFPIYIQGDIETEEELSALATRIYVALFHTDRLIEECGVSKEDKLLYRYSDAYAITIPPTEEDPTGKTKAFIGILYTIEKR